MKRTIMVSAFFLALAFSQGFAGVQMIQSFSEQISTRPHFGTSVAGAGDVNGDGYDDVIIGASGYCLDTGRTYVYFGGSSMDNTADVTMTGEETMNHFGQSVSRAGDVNNDGYDDVIVGARYYAGSGRAYVYFGGSSMNDEADVIMSEGDGDLFGYSVSCAGDLNNDGYDDVIIGAPYYGFSTGHAYIYLGGSSMDNTVDMQLTSPVSGINFGCSVSGIGDFDGHGYNDLIVGALTGNRAYLYIGIGYPVDGIPDFMIEGEEAGDYFGDSVSSAGDVNDDVYDDVIAGAPRNNSSTGRAYVYFGCYPLSEGPTVDVTMTGEGTDDQFGLHVSGAGDVDNDGYDDVIVGAGYHDSSAGRAYVFFGGSAMNNSADVTMDAEASLNYFGCSVSGAGDLNDDGYEDVIIGAWGYDFYTGRAYLYFGGATPDNTADVTLMGEALNGYFGNSVSGAGDVNADGYDDVIVGAYGAATSTGRAHVYFGGASMNNTADVTMTGETTGDCFGTSVSETGDLNGDGYDDVIVGARKYSSATGRTYVYFGGPSMDNTADLIMTGEATNNSFGCSVSGAGDINGDGYGDAIVGAFFYNSGRGRAYAYFGGSSMDATADATLTGEALNTLGVSVSGAGDVNGDGYGDVIVGATRYSSYTGRAFIFFGGTSMDAAADVTMTGEGTGNYFGNSVSGAGDLNCDGYDEVMVGADYHNSSTGRVYIYLGGSSPDNTPDFTISGSGTDNYFGCSVSDAGDVNGDGILEVIVGAFGYDSNIGEAYIYQAFVNARVSAWLQGPYQTGGSMTTALKTADVIPLVSPYADGRTVSAVPEGMTDWVSLALRSSSTGPDVFQRSFFIKSDGSIVDMDGITSNLKMPGLADGGYYLLLRHRNHLAVMSASTVSLGTFAADLYNFCSGPEQYFGGGAMLLETGVYGAYAGDTNATGTVDANDRSAAWNNRNKTGYEGSDCNLSGTVDANDRSTTWNNRNKTTSVP